MKTVCPCCQTSNRLPTERVNDVATCGRCKAQLFTGGVINATAATLDKYLQDELPVIIDFWAPWCAPCLNFAPVYEAMASERSGKMRFLKVNTEAEPALSRRFSIRSIPTIMVFKQGQMVDMLNGAMPGAPFGKWLDETI